MSCAYKFKFTASLKTGQAKTMVRETYSFPRRDAEKKLAEMRAQKELHPGEVRLKDLLEQCLENSRAKKFTITLERENP